MTWIDPDRWYKPAEVAKRLDLSTNTVRDFIKRGDLHARRDVGPRGASRYYVSGAALAAYIRGGDSRGVR